MRNECIVMERLHQVVPRFYYSARKYLLEQARKRGLKQGQPRILDFLSRNNGCIQKRFCDEFSLEPSSISNLLLIMEREGVLYRERNAQSSRIVNVFITDHGKDVQQQMEEVYDKFDEISFDGFSPEEKEQCLWYLERLTTNMMTYRDNNSK